jgi:hypothetical protein
MTRAKENGARLEPKAAWSVVVVYEDPATRERAVGFCNQLVKRFWTRFEINVSWWSFALLEECPAAKEAAERAARADLIVFSAAPEGDFPAQVKDWIETWLIRRGDREGMMAGLLEPADNSTAREGPRHVCLRNAARRAAMDYLTQVPQDISRSIPDSLESYTARADQVTSLLDDILRRQTPPPHLLP